MAQIPTVRIVHPTAKGGYARINECDFDPAMHVLFDQRPVNDITAPIQDDVSRETPAPKKRGRPRKTEV